MKPREYTEEEVREKFLKTIWGYIGYWERENRALTSKDKMEGLAHSILSMLDGSNIDLPAWILAPLPHKSDKLFHVVNEENYFPYNPRDEKTGAPTQVNCDIAGGLAYELFRVRDRMEGKTT